MEVLLI